MSGEYRQHLFPRDHLRLAELRGLDPYRYGQLAQTPGTFTGGLIEGWTPLYRNEFHGITEDGTLREGLYPRAPARPGEEAPVEAMVTAAGRCSRCWTTTAAAGSPTPSMPWSGRLGPIRNSCSSTPACGWTCSRRPCARKRSP